jgi:hypothetical protein
LRREIDEVMLGSDYVSASQLIFLI